MNFKTLTKEEVKGLVPATPKRPARGIKRVRANDLACYTPAGSAQASRRITGSHLDPDSKEMETAVLYFAEGLLDAMGQGRGGIRSIIGPARCSDRILERYCRKLLKSAMGKRSEFHDHPISPLLVQYLVGGVPWKNIDALIYRALGLLDFYTQPMGVTTLATATQVLGFGDNIRHQHRDTTIKYDIDNLPYEAEFDKVHAHLSFRQDFLVHLPKTGSYASMLIREGAYDDGLRRQIASWKPAIMAQAERLIDPAGGEMSQKVADGDYGPKLAVAATDEQFIRAVRRVFEKDWDELDLLAVDPIDRFHDIEVLMARLLIQRMGYAPQITAQQLVGMSVLTGVSIANWTAFAVKDKQRRGETFITAGTVAEIIELCQGQAGFGEEVEQELRSDMYVLDNPTELAAAKRKWARRLQSPNNPLWSTNGLYYQVGATHHGVPICKPKPFRPTALESDDDL